MIKDKITYQIKILNESNPRFDIEDWLIRLLISSYLNKETNNGENCEKK